MDLIRLPAARLAGVSVSTLRNHIHARRLTGYARAGRLHFERAELLAAFGPRPLAPLAEPAPG